MSYERVFDRIIFECDGCADTLDTEERQWEYAKKLFDDEYWYATHDGATWRHFCNACWQKRRAGDVA